MSYILADMPVLMHVLVRREFTQNLQEGHGEFLSAIVIGIRCIHGRSLQFHVRFDSPKEAGAMFIVPIQGIVWKECGSPVPPNDLVQPWDVFSSDFTVHEFGLLRASKGYVLNKTAMHMPPRLRSKYVCTVDFSGNALADDFEQHKQLHIVLVEDGWVGAFPNNRWLSEDTAFAPTCLENPRFQSLEHNFSAECTLDLP